jgi:hypothetical protein
VRSKDSRRGDLTTHNRSMSDHAPLYAVLILALGLGIVATPLVLLALLLFLTTQNAHSSKKSKGELQHPAARVFHRDKDLDP